MTNTGENWVGLGIALGVMWLAQFGLSFLQMRRYYGRISKLRKTGLTATGMSGNRVRTRTYVVLVLDEDLKVKTAEQLSGITVFASLKPIKQLIGLHVDDVWEGGEIPKSVGKNVWSAACAAAQYLRDHLDKPVEAEQPVNGVASEADKSGESKTADVGHFAQEVVLQAS